MDHHNIMKILELLTRIHFDWNFFCSPPFRVPKAIGDVMQYHEIAKATINYLKTVML